MASLCLCSVSSQHSNMLNQARLSVLKARDDHVKRLLEESRIKLSEITKDTARWKKILQELITQVHSGVVVMIIFRISISSFVRCCLLPGIVPNAGARGCCAL